MKLLTIIAISLFLTACGDGHTKIEPETQVVSPLFDVREVQTSPSRCESEKALFMQIFYDENRDGIGQAEELYSVSYLCFGADGLQGPQGEQGEQGIPGLDAIAEIIDPCSDVPGIYDEVILKLSTGQLLASFSDNVSGLNTRFSLLTPGSYMTTDGSSCAFTVTSDYQVTW